MSDCISIYIGYNFSQIATNNKLGAIVKGRQIDKENIPSNLYYSYNNFSLRKENNGLAIIQIFKFLNKNISKSNDFDISINQTNFGESMIKFKKKDLKITVQKLISKFLSLLINNVKVQNIKQIKKVICTIPSYFDEKQKNIIKIALNEALWQKSEPLNENIFLLPEAIATLITLKKEFLEIEKFDIKNYYLLISIYDDLLDLAIISINDNFDYVLRGTNCISDFESVSSHLNKKYKESEQKEIIKKISQKGIDLPDINKIYNTILNHCKSLLNNANLEMKKIKELIIIEKNGKNLSLYNCYFKGYFKKIHNIDHQDAFIYGVARYEPPLTIKKIKIKDEKKQTINIEEKNEIQNNKNLITNIQELQKIEEQINLDFNEKNKVLEKENEKLKKELENSKKKLEELNKKIQKLEKEKNKNKTENKDQTENIKAFESEIKKLEKDLENEKVRALDFKNSLEKITKEKEQIDGEKQDLLKQVMSLNLIIEQKMSSEEKISNCINENYEEIKKIIDENLKQNEEEKKKFEKNQNEILNLMNENNKKYEEMEKKINILNQNEINIKYKNQEIINKIDNSINIIKEINNNNKDFAIKIGNYFEDNKKELNAVKLEIQEIKNQKNEEKKK